MNRVEQRTDDDCVIASLAMMLDKEYDEVKGWFTSSKRMWNDFRGLTFTLLERKYDVSFGNESGIGRWGGLRRLVAIVPAAEPNSEGHVFVIDETETVHDPSPRTPTPFDMQTLSRRLIGQKVECVVRIERVDVR
ncbi:MAG: hypothetical protein ACLQLC_06905 [Candidatus Sulfotelmatobacter sp.]